MNASKQKRMEAFLAEPHLARLATVSRDGQPHVVPVWFLWEEGAAWVSSYRTTRKIRELENNPKCALVVDVPKPQHGITGILLEGEADLEPVSCSGVRERTERLYLKYLSQQGILDKEPQEWLSSPENMLIKVKPKRVITW